MGGAAAPPSTAGSVAGRLGRIGPDGVGHGAVSELGPVHEPVGLGGRAAQWGNAPVVAVNLTVGSATVAIETSGHSSGISLIASSKRLGIKVTMSKTRLGGVGSVQGVDGVEVAAEADQGTSTSRGIIRIGRVGTGVGLEHPWRAA